MKPTFVCGGIRTPIGRYGGVLAPVRPDDLAAIVLRELLARNLALDPSAVDDVILGCANQAGEDNRNIARMSALLAGYPKEVPGVTVNRLCGSGMDAIASASRAIGIGEADIIVAGGVESMSRAPYVISKSAVPFGRDVQMFDTTMGWRFVNPALKALYGAESMPETAENVAAAFSISREDQDAFALRSQQRALAAQAQGYFAEEIVPVVVAGKKGAVTVSADEHPRDTSLEKLAKLPASFRTGGTVTAGNSSGINDGACALLLASEDAVKRYGLIPRARVLGTQTTGVLPTMMGIGPISAVQKLLRRLGLDLGDMNVIELNEAFAAQALAVLRGLDLPDDSPIVNPWGGAIALGHPLGASGARLVATAVHQLTRSGARLALCAMCIGVGQGIAMAVERC